MDSRTVMRNIFMGRELVCKVGPFRWLDLRTMGRQSMEALDSRGSEVGVFRRDQTSIEALTKLITLR